MKLSLIEFFYILSLKDSSKRISLHLSADKLFQFKELDEDQLQQQSNTNLKFKTYFELTENKIFESFKGNIKNISRKSYF